MNNTTIEVMPMFSKNSNFSLEIVEDIFSSYSRRSKCEYVHKVTHILRVNTL